MFRPCSIHSIDHATKESWYFLSIHTFCETDICVYSAMSTNDWGTGDRNMHCSVFTRCSTLIAQLWRTLTSWLTHVSSSATSVNFEGACVRQLSKENWHLEDDSVWCESPTMSTKRVLLCDASNIEICWSCCGDGCEIQQYLSTTRVWEIKFISIAPFHLHYHHHFYPFPSQATFKGYSHVCKSSLY